MAGKSSNETLLEQLRHGLAKFELVSSPVPSISSYSPSPNRTPTSYKTNLFFARIGGGVSPAMKKIERYSVKKVNGDGRCLFRALVKGMAIHKGVSLNSREETENADELRTAVKEVICDNDKERHEYAPALMAITVDESLKRYCQRIGRSDFWGGESELLVLSKLCQQPIIVYIPEHEVSQRSPKLDLILGQSEENPSSSWSDYGSGFSRAWEGPDICNLILIFHKDVLKGSNA